MNTPIGSPLAPELERAALLVLGRASMRGIRRDELRRAFHQRALDLHPDRAATLGGDPRLLVRQFQDLCAAHALLERALAPDPPMTRVRTNSARAVPPRTLRFAEFLYYKGRISWSDLAEAVAWRRSAARRIGQWFVEQGLIGAAEVRLLRDQLLRHNASQPG